MSCTSLLSTKHFVQLCFSSSSDVSPYKGSTSCMNFFNGIEVGSFVIERGSNIFARLKVLGSKAISLSIEGVGGKDGRPVVMDEVEEDRERGDSLEIPPCWPAREVINVDSSSWSPMFVNGVVVESIVLDCNSSR